MTTAVESLSRISMTDTETTDWLNLRQAAEGDGEAFASIVERHQGRLLRLCERMLSDREEARDEQHRAREIEPRVQSGKSARPPRRVRAGPRQRDR